MKQRTRCKKAILQALIITLIYSLLPFPFPFYQAYAADKDANIYLTGENGDTSEFYVKYDEILKKYKEEKDLGASKRLLVQFKYDLIWKKDFYNARFNNPLAKNLRDLLESTIVRTISSDDKIVAETVILNYDGYCVFQFSDKSTAEKAQMIFTEGSKINYVEYCEFDSFGSFAEEELVNDNSDQSNEATRLMIQESANKTGLVDLKSAIMNNDSDNREIKVAILDTGIDRSQLFEHKDRILEGVNLLNAADDTTDNSEAKHGTAIAKIILETTPQNVKLLPIKVSEKHTDQPMILKLNQAIEKAIELKADVINMSMQLSANTQIQNTIINAINHGIAVVVSAGNVEGQKELFIEEHDVYQIPNIIIVTGSNSENNPDKISRCLRNSTTTISVTIAAPVAPGNTVNKAGTSYSAAYVSASVALVKLIPKYSDASVPSIKQVLSNNATPWSSAAHEHIGIYGPGVLSLHKIADEFNNVTYATKSWLGKAIRSDTTKLSNRVYKDGRFTNVVVNDDQFADISQFNSLKCIVVQSSEITNLQPLKNIKDKTLIEELDLQGNKITDFSVLSEFKGLKHLDISGENNSIKSLDALKELKNLETLTLNVNSQTSNLYVLRELSMLNRLTMYYDSSTTVGANDMERIPASVESLEVYAGKMFDLSNLGFRSALKTLKIVCSDPENDDLSTGNLNRLYMVDMLIGLKELTLSGCDLSDSDVSKPTWGRLNELERLDLSNNINIKSITPLLKLKNLTYLNLSGTGVKKSEIDMLKTILIDCKIVEPRY